MLKLSTLTLIGALAVAPAAFSQAASDASGVYAIEPGHTQVLFGVNHMGFTTYYGSFPGASGSLTLDAKTPGASQVDVSVPVAGVAVQSGILAGELKSPQWFDAGKYPAMTFHSTKITPTGANTADVAGDLTIHGVTKPVVLKAKFNRGGPNPMSKAYTVGFEVSGQIKRSEFGVSTYVPVIGDDVDLIISAAFEKKKAS